MSSWPLADRSNAESLVEVDGYAIFLQLTTGPMADEAASQLVRFKWQRLDSDQREVGSHKYSWI